MIKGTPVSNCRNCNGNTLAIVSGEVYKSQLHEDCGELVLLHMVPSQGGFKRFHVIDCFVSVLRQPGNLSEIFR
jgi:hypothetical protein